MDHILSDSKLEVLLFVPIFVVGLGLGAYFTTQGGLLIRILLELSSGFGGLFDFLKAIF